MSRLTEKQETKLMRLVRAGGAVRGIAADAGVSIGTVVNFRKACGAVDAMSNEMQSKRRDMLISGLTPEVIASRVLLPAESVKSLRRLDRFHSPGGGVSECGECGAKVFAKLGEGGRGSRRGKWNGCGFSTENFTKLLRISMDVLELGDLRIITNPLFYSLVQSSERIIEEVNGKEKDSRQPR